MLDQIQVMPPARRTALFRAGVAGLFVMMAAAQWLLARQHVFYISADEAARTHHAWMAMMGWPQPLDVWPPLPTWIIEQGLRLRNDLLWTPRAVTFAFASVWLAAFLALTQALFRRRAVTLFAGLLAVLFAQRAVLAAVALAEMQYFTWITLALWLIWRALHAPRGALLWHMLAAAALALASMTRYEAWFFAGGYGLLLLWLAARERSCGALVRLVLAGAWLLAFPAYWMILFTREKGSALTFIGETSGQYATLLGSTFAQNFEKSVFAQFFMANAVQLNLLGVVALVALMRARPALRRWAFVPLVAMLVTGALGLAGKAMPTHNFWRVATVWSLLLIPFTALLAVRLLEGSWFAWRQRALQHAAGLTLVCALPMLNLRESVLWIPRFAARPAEMRTGQYIGARLAEDNLKKPTAALIDAGGLDGQYLKISLFANTFGKLQLNIYLEPEFRTPPPPEERAAYLARLAKGNLRYVLYRKPEAVERLRAYPELSAEQQFDDWVVFAMTQTSTPPAP